MDESNAKAVKWATGINFDDHFDVKSRRDYEKDLRATIGKQDEQAAMTMRNLLEESMLANERLVKERSAMEARILCVICRENLIDISFVQCGHTGCSACFSRLPDQHNGLPQCPVCREPILATHQIYFP